MTTALAASIVAVGRRWRPAGRPRSPTARRRVGRRHRARRRRASQRRPSQRAPRPIAGPTSLDGTVARRRRRRRRPAWSTAATAAARALGGTHVGVLVDEAVERHCCARTAAAQRVARRVELYGPPRRWSSSCAPRRSPTAARVATIDDVSERRRARRGAHRLRRQHQPRAEDAGRRARRAGRDAGRRATTPAVVHRVADTHGRARRTAPPHTIDDLLELSRIELGGEPVRDVGRRRRRRRREAIDRGRRARRRSRDIGIAALDPTVPRTGACTSLGDRRQLVSALGNLVDNAVKYSDAGGIGAGAGHACRRRAGSSSTVDRPRRRHPGPRPRPHLRALLPRRPGPQPRRPAAPARVWRSCATSPPTTAARSLVASTEGEGSTFTLRMPVAADRTDVTATARPRGSRMSQPTVLVVEDEASFVEALHDRPAPRGLPRRGRHRRRRGARAVRHRATRPRAARRDAAADLRASTCAGSCASEPGADHHGDGEGRARSTPSSASRSAPTTTSPSRTGSASWSPGCAPCCAARPATDAPASSARPRLDQRRRRRARPRRAPRHRRRRARWRCR